MDIQLAEDTQPRTFAFKAGDTVRASLRVLEGERERLQIFEGVVLRRRGRKVSLPKRVFLVDRERLRQEQREKVDRLLERNPNLKPFYWGNREAEGALPPAG